MTPHLRDLEVNYSIRKSLLCLEVALEEKLKLIKEEFHSLLDKWCKSKLGCSIIDAEQVVINSPMAMFTDFHAFYLSHRKQARNGSNMFQEFAYLFFKTILFRSV